MNERNRNLLTAVLVLALLGMSFMAFHFSRKSGRFYHEKDEMQGRMDSLDIANHKAQSSLATFRAENEELQATLETTRQQHANTVRTLKGQVEEYKKEVEVLRQRMAESQSDPEARRQFEQIKSDLEAAEQQLLAEQHKSDSLSNEIIALVALNNRVTGKMRELVFYTKEITRGLGRLDVRIDLQATGQIPASDIAQATEATVRAAELRLDEARAALAEFAQQPWAGDILQEFEILQQELTDKKQVIRKLSEEFNTVYLCVGTTDELVQRGILSKRGKREYDFHPEKMSSTGCRPFHRREPLLSFPARGDLQLYPPPPEGSYRQIQSGSPSEKRLQLLDPDQFWQNGKIIVVRAD